MLRSLLFKIINVAAVTLMIQSHPASAALMIEGEGSSSMPKFALVSRSDSFDGEYGQDWIFQDVDGSIPPPGSYPKVTVKTEGNALSIHISTMPAGMAENSVRIIEIADITSKQTRASLYIHNFAGKVMVGSSEVSISNEPLPKLQADKSCKRELKKKPRKTK